MNSVIFEKGKTKVPVKVWAGEIDSKTREQVISAASLPFVHKHIALMPDAHAGYGVPIGCVLPTKGYIIPNAIGVDIGCGMCLVNTGLHLDDINIETVMRDWQENIPVGFDAHSIQSGNMGSRAASLDIDFAQTAELRFLEDFEDTAARLSPGKARRWSTQIGTLGGGNHFVALQVDDTGIVHVMIHSGSRGFGANIADAYHRIAQDKCEKWFSDLPHKDLAYLPTDDESGIAYIFWMKQAQKFAYHNRMVMMWLALRSLGATNKIRNMVNIHHNYAAIENHYGENVWVHRKGATCVRKGITGIIPGSMNTSSFVVDGLGSDESFHSCSHGAGRNFSRSEAKRRIDAGLDPSQEEQLSASGTKLYGTEDARDELGSAYKDIDEVMANQKDLVSIRTRLRDVAVLKG